MEPRVLLSAARPGHRVPAATAAAENTAAENAAAKARAVPAVVLAAAPTAKHGKATGKRKASGRTASPFATAYAHGLFPAQVRGAYGLGTYGSGTVRFDGVEGTGAGQTIAFVDAYDDPDVAGDLTAFSRQFNLPTDTSLTIVNQTGGTALPPQDTTGSWAVEDTVDLEWAHAIAPAANLLLVEATTSDPANLFAAARTAAAYPGVTAVSMSFGVPEYAGDYFYDGSFTTPAGHPGVTFFAAAGDGGAAVEYPAVSANVVAVGGTALTVNNSATGVFSYSGETAWSGSGGGVSQHSAQPAYQSFVVPAAVSGVYRTVPDVAAVAAVTTPLAVYDSYTFGSATPWVGVGGTSVSSPIWAALAAVANQGRAAEGLPSLDSSADAQQTLTRLYQLPAADFNDVTAGSNGYPAGPGYDLVTGRGTPVANTLVDDLAGVAAVTGRAYVDLDGDGTYDAAIDTPIAAATVYLDLNNDGVMDDGEPSTTTAADGTYGFADEPAGGTVRLASPALPGYVAVPTHTSAALTYGPTDTADFAFFPTTFATSAADAAYTLRTDPTGTTDQILLNGSLVGQCPLAALPTLTFKLTGTGDGLTVDAAAGDPVPAGGVTVTGSAATPGAALTVLGTAGNDAITASSTAVTFSSTTISYADLSTVSIDPGAGTDSLTVTGGTVLVPATPAGGGVVARRFSDLTVAAAATVAFGTPAAHADRAVVAVTGTLSVAGTLDLGGNDMVVRDGTLTGVAALLATGHLTSAAAAADPTRLRTLGVTLNEDADGLRLYGGVGEPTFDGLLPNATDVLVKFTYYGDANLDGTVDGSDYARVDVGSTLHLTGWADGDFNADGTVDGSDYTLIDNAFNDQGPPM